MAAAARANDKQAKFSPEPIKSLGSAGLLGIMLPADMGGSALGTPYVCSDCQRARRSGCLCRNGLLMHGCAAATIGAARDGAAVSPILKEIVAGELCAEVGDGMKG